MVIWNRLKADPQHEIRWKRWKLVNVDENGRKLMKVDESGWKWLKVDGSGWKWMKVNESGWKWMKVDERGWKRLKVVESGWNIRGATSISDTFFLHTCRYICRCVFRTICQMPAYWIPPRATPVQTQCKASHQTSTCTICKIYHYTSSRTMCRLTVCCISATGNSVPCIPNYLQGSVAVFSTETNCKIIKIILIHSPYKVQGSHPNKSVHFCSLNGTTMLWICDNCISWWSSGSIL